MTWNQRNLLFLLIKPILFYIYAWELLMA